MSNYILEKPNASNFGVSSALKKGAAGSSETVMYV
jgi:hypothetical protein